MPDRESLLLLSLFNRGGHALNLPKPQGMTKWKNRELEARTKNIRTPFGLKEQGLGLKMEKYSFGTAGNIIMIFGLNFTNKRYTI
ncbi:MAG: hypothetical protein ACJ71D_03840 [Nitrososphaera sp.]